MSDLRISATTVESFRRFWRGTYETVEQREKAEACFLAQVRKEDEPTEFMLLGSAFHLILETPAVYRDGAGYIANGIYFSDDVVERCLKAIPQGGVRECKEIREYGINGKNIVVVSKVDQIHGAHIWEHKTCWRGFMFDRYSKSIQWRLYMDAFAVPIVRYNVFEMKKEKMGEILLKNIHSFYFFRYSSIVDDIRSALSDLEHYIRIKNLERYFQPKEEEAR